MSDVPDPVSYREFVRDRRERGESLKDASKKWKKIKESPAFQLDKIVHRAFRKERLPDPVPSFREHEGTDFQFSDDRKHSREQKRDDYYEF